jgi:hypothetical protein
VAINGKPVFLQLALDQAYHPTGFYTFPSDSFTRMEILRARRSAERAPRAHQDRDAAKAVLGGQAGRADHGGRAQLVGAADRHRVPRARRRDARDDRRDYNHPSIFSWIAYNESWGLLSKVNGKDVYLPETQRRVVESCASRNRSTRRGWWRTTPVLRPGPHETDINSWHEYLPGGRGRDACERIATARSPARPWNFEKGYARRDSR